MSGLFNQGQDFIHDSIFGKTTTMPATIYLCLLTTEPTETSTISTLAEPSGGYTRVSVANNGTTWSSSVNGLKRTNIAISFPTPTADWGTINYYAFTTTSDNTGVALLWGELTVAKTVLTGVIPTFDAGAIVLNVTSIQPSIVA